MNAKEFRKIYANTIKAPTDRKIVNLARKLGLRDTFENILWQTSLPVDKAKEFVKQD
jgi:hypothetical protein